MDYEKEISFGAFDSELMHQEIFIPEGFEATIDGNKIILKKIESEDERIRKELIEHVKDQQSSFISAPDCRDKYEEEENNKYNSWLSWLEKKGNQKSKKVPIWKHWKDGICGNGEGKLIYLIKDGDDYSLSSSLGFECDYIELSELDNLMLEKQGEKKCFLNPSNDKDIRSFVQEIKRLAKAYDLNLPNRSYDIYAFAKDELERQGEQKPVDNVGSKFKVGDWCIDNEDGTIFQIVKVLDNTYTYKTNEGKEYSCSHYSLENDAHLWTIQDARLGDVLANCNIICIYKKRESEHLIKVYLNYSLAEGVEITDDTIGDFNLYPATKEQRDTLFAKMKEAGYEWDAEKKELKKVEKKSQRMISAEAKEAMYDKPTDEDMKEALRTEYEKGRADAIAQMQKEWSEEDKDFMYDTLSNLTELKDRYGEGYGNVGRCIDWVKDLKNRVQPQPKQEWSEEDEKKQKKNY